MLDANASVAEALIAAHLDMHTRFPVTERPADPQAVIGYVNFKDIVSHLRLAPQAPSLRAILRPIPSLAADSPGGTGLEQLIRGRCHIALVRNAGGQVVGLVTLEDMLEELVGEIEDEYDRLPVHAVAAGNGWVVGGGLSVERLREIAGLELPQASPEDRAQTVSEWVTRQLGRPPRGGDVLCRSMLRIVVRKARRQKVLEAQVEALPTTANAATAPHAAAS
jgi:putative hemolysin